ncbi:hypothetical protein [Tenacibaculum caenipelagi]|uniref:Uncharacterized protein n=1 Tax=Tenacibaculum caenipelagi TaxID=1325435 RepID=A0A4R6TIG3_9FLAO|nr:hypothetical protein [Tenacibaculum caenipelagi]TDQ28532.1 hypothetical protein DFQ07_0908 [Tenacibaculum caenipelagi]
MMTPSKIKHKGFTAFLLLLVIVIGFLSYQNAEEYTELKKVFELEKNELESELTSIITDYKETYYKKNEFSLKLKDKIHRVVQLRDSVKNLKETDYKFIRYYSKKTKELVSENKILFSKIDSLNKINDNLLSKNDSVNKALLKKENQNTKLESINRFLHKEKQVLKEKIASAEVIEISTIKAKAMKKRKNGKYTSTTRSNKTDAFKVTFDLLENKIINSGPKEIGIQILDERDNVVSPLKKVHLKNNKKIWCSDVLITEYQNEQLSIVSLVNISNDKINTGIYHINAFVNGVHVGNNTIALK